MNLINPAPTFTAGQVLSAGGHLNALARTMQDLHDAILSFHEGFNGIKAAVAGYQGAIRHRYNTLDWKYTIVSGTVYLVYTSAAGVATTITGTSNTGAGTYSGQADLTALGFTDGAFYTVSIGGGGTCDVWLLREVRTATYPSLATFADESVPTAAQWQALSTYANELATETLYPYTPLVRSPDPSIGSLYIGTLHHQCRYLTLEVRHGGSISVKINGNEVGPYTGSATGSIWPEIDLDAIASPPAYGADYEIEVTCDANGELFLLTEWPGDTEIVPSWTTLPEWAHGDYVYGSTTSKKLQTITGNLAVLGGVAKYQNYPCGLARETYNWRFQMRRHYRYLHFYRSVSPAETQDTKIAYLVGAAYREQTLQWPAAGPWQVFDLESVPGLWPTTNYLIAGCSYAIEDVEI